MPLVLDPIQSGYNLSKINENFEKIQDTWDEKLDRVNSGSFYNQMDQTLDMNSNEIINVKTGDSDGSLVTKGYVDTQDNKRVLKAGDSMTGQLNTIDPVQPSNATNKRYVDGMIATIDGVEGIVPLVSPRQQGDGVTTVFPTIVTSQHPTQSYSVNLDGVTQRPQTDFTADTNGNVVFDEAPEVGVDIDITVFEPVNLQEAADLSQVTATGSTTPRTLADRFADTINVKDFGAVGDGVTDDRAAIQAALDASPIGKIFFPFTGASYVIGSTHPTETDYGLLIQSDNIIFESESGSTNSPYTLLCTVPMTSVISSTSRRDGIQFRNFSIDSNNLADHGVYLSDEYFPYMLWDNVHLTRSKINNAQLSTFTSTFNQCRFSRSEQDGVRIQGLGTGVATSVTMNTCYALQNVAKGFDFKNFIYSTLNSCASDTNALAYYFDTAYSTVMSGCGAEGCEKAIYVNGYRGFSINQFYGAVLGTDGTPEEYLIEFVSGTDATIAGFFQQSPKNYDYILGVTGSSYGSENVTVLDYSIKRDDIFFVTNFTFNRPIKLFRDDYSTKDETVNLAPSELFEYLNKLQYKNIDHTLTIQLSDGAQPDENTPSLVKLKGAGTIIIQGNAADRTAVELRAGGLEPWFIDECSCLVKFKNLTIRNRTTDSTSVMVRADNARAVILENVELFNSTTAQNAINATDGSTIYLTNGTEATPNPVGFFKVYQTDKSSSIVLQDNNAIPTTGVWDRGQRFYHSNPVAGGNIGWVCTATGLPGTWKTFGSIEA